SDHRRVRRVDPGQRQHRGDEDPAGSCNGRRLRHRWRLPARHLGLGGRRRHHLRGQCGPRRRACPGRETRTDRSTRMKVVLAYPGGLDTSVILTWLREEYGADVVAYTADVGQGAEVGEARQKAIDTGAVEAVVE